MNNAFMVVPAFNHPINIEHATTPLPVPPGTAWVRFSLASAQPMRDRPQFGARLQIWWTDSLGRIPIARDLWFSLPRDRWEDIEIQEGLPIASHAVDSPPGIVPHDVGPFAYVVEQAPAVNQADVVKLPAGYDRVFLKYTLLGGNNGSPVNVAVVLEALDASEQPLEFV